MKEGTRNVLAITGILFLFFLIWYFRAIVAYILIAVVLSLVGRPLVRFFQRIRFGRYRFSKGISAFTTLMVMWVVLAGFFSFMIPLLVSEFEQLSTIDSQSVISEVERPLRELMTLMGNRSVETENWTLFDMVKTQFGEHFNFSELTNIFGVVASTLGDLVIAVFSISFITFFFLQEESMFREGILLFVPAAYEEKVSGVLNSAYKLLRRYLVGLILEVFMVGLLVTAGLTVVGIGFSHAVLIGVVCGLFNIIPYLGPWIGAFVGLLIGLAIHVQSSLMMTDILPLLGLMSLVFAAVQLIDNIVFQPLIYSSSVKAHPLEIFLVILVAGTIAGIIGMIVAIPGYTILRVIAKEFLNDLKVVRKLTENLR